MSDKTKFMIKTLSFCISFMVEPFSVQNVDLSITNKSIHLQEQFDQQLCFI